MKGSSKSEKKKQNTIKTIGFRPNNVQHVETCLGVATKIKEPQSSFLIKSLSQKTGMTPNKEKHTKSVKIQKTSGLGVSKSIVFILLICLLLF